jgi:hypothetical protein
MAKRPMKPSANGYNFDHSVSRQIVDLTGLIPGNWIVFG